VQLPHANRFEVGESRILLKALKPINEPQVFTGFASPFQANFEISLQISQDRFLPYSYALLILP
jgi:hypothetical protein